ncbi:uncharacterized protein METZ01_LOCUS322509, partial [marine metagenome]
MLKQARIAYSLSGVDGRLLPGSWQGLTWT